MNTLGIIGGMSPERTAAYYTQINRLINRQKGGNHSAPILLASVEFQEIVDCQQRGDWHKAGEILAQAARTLEQAGADAVLLATNTMHKVADQMMQGVGIPLLHIADATAAAINRQGLKRPGLMATAFTMEQDFYTARLRAAGLEPVIPDAADRAETHRIIYEELCREVVKPESEQAYRGIAGRLVDRGADCLILGCTEVGMLLNAGNVSVPVFDTTLVHCEAAVERALG